MFNLSAGHFFLFVEKYFHMWEAPGKTQDTLEGLSLSAGLGTPQDHLGRAGRSGWGEGSLGFPAQTAAP